MKRYLSLVVLGIFAILILATCKNLVTDLPETDVTQYISGNSVTFPKGTNAIDIYNTVVYLYSDNEYHNITNGSWKYIKTANTGGLTNQTWESVVFSKVKHTYIKSDSGINTHIVYLWTSDTSIKEIVFQWQRQTTNTWQNKVIEGDITFTL
jgi:hypothetical protein